MVSYAALVGVWHNYSLRGWSDGQVTLPTFLSVLLASAIATYIGIVGKQFWTIVAFIIHQWRAAPSFYDGLHHIQQAIYKNLGSPLGAVWGLFKSYRAYSGLKNWWRLNQHAPPYTERRKHRWLGATAAPIVVWLVFTTTRLFAASLITHPAYKVNIILAKQSNCGNEEWNRTSPEGQRAFEQSTIRAATNARDYVNTCYNTTDATSCSTLPRQKLPYNLTQGGTCPFGNRCKASPVTMTTEWLDSHTIFGINAPMNERIQIRKVNVCAVVDVDDLTTLVSIGDGLQGHEYYLGPIQNVSDFTTYALDRHAFDYAGYDVQPYYAHAGVANAWKPIPDFDPLDGDIGLFVIRFGSVQYQVAVSDPLFAANNRTSYMNQTRFLPDDVAGLVACVERYQIQDPSGSMQTNLSSLVQVQIEHQKLGFNKAQLAAAARLILPSILAGMYNAVNGLGVGALRAQRNVFSTVSTGLPDNQWVIEVAGWFETTLATLQHRVVAYATKPSDDLSPYYTLTTNVTTSEGVDLTDELAKMCQNQAIRNIADYQTFSLLGLILVAVLGLLIIVLSWTIEKIDDAIWRAVSWVRARWTKDPRPRPNLRLTQWSMDSIYHLQRLAYQNAGQGEWHMCTEDIPAAKGTFQMVGLDGDTPGYQPLGDAELGEQDGSDEHIALADL